MEKLMKPAEYAKELGISRQAVYAKIKRGILKAKDVEGKLYIVVDAAKQNQESAPKPTNVSANKATTSHSKTLQEYEKLLAAKDETISVLKGTVKDLKKSNKQITTTLKGEIELLKEAFHEMRTLYAQQLTHHTTIEHETIDISSEDEVEKLSQWVSVKKVLKYYNIDRKSKEATKVLKRIKKAFKAGDERVKEVNEKFKLNLSADLNDLIGA